MALRTLADYLSLYRRSSGRGFLPPHAHPFLVGRRVDLAQREFQTAVISLDDVVGGSLREQVPLDAIVLPVVKRPDGAFPGRVGVGRVSTVDIRIPSAEVSKYHAYFSCDADGWTLTDASSRNGTWVDGERLMPGRPVALWDGACVQFANESFVHHSAEGLYGYLAELNVSAAV
ncbi:MAG: FHA domain-containing protein [Nannocystaceae bacterium]|nr:FHA domain-containing protein [bacterium]